MIGIKTLSSGEINRTSECHERFSFRKRILSLHKQESRELSCFEH